MPCYTPDYRDEQFAQERKNFTHNSPVAEMLCALIRREGISTKALQRAHKDLPKWWIEHLKRDSKKA